MNKINSVAIGIRNINTKSGLGKIVLEQVNYFLSQGITIDIYTSKYDKLIAKTGVNIIKIPRIPFVGEYYQRLLFAKSASKKIARQSYDLVVGHGDLVEQDVMFLHNLVERAYYETHKKKMDPLNAIARLRRDILNTQNFKLLIANSQLMKDELISTFNIPAEKIKVIYPGFDPLQFNTHNHAQIRSDVRQSLNIDEQVLLIGFITSGDFKKRALDLFIEALHHMKSTQAYKVLLVGKDKNLPYYLDMAKKYGLLEKFIIQEPIDQVERYFHAVDFTVHPAHFEEFGMVVQEAMACGVPVITSKYVGASEIILDSSTVMPTLQSEALAKQIQRLANDPTLRAKLTETALASVKKTTWKSYIENFILYSKEVL